MTDRPGGSANGTPMIPPELTPVNAAPSGLRREVRVREVGGRSDEVPAATAEPAGIVWSGYEVGILFHSGNTISTTHPDTSPARAAYEAFVGPDNWIPSFAPAAVYHAIRPWDPGPTR